jgi:hypothetical protein
MATANILTPIFMRKSADAALSRLFQMSDDARSGLSSAEPTNPAWVRRLDFRPDLNTRCSTA